MRLFTALLLLSGVAASATHQASAQEGFLGWVGLHAQNRLGWLENENQIGELCRSSTDLEACRARMLAPIVDTFSLHAGARRVLSPRR